jgi:hypothetical protein
MFCFFPVLGVGAVEVADFGYETLDVVNVYYDEIVG